MTEPFEFQNWPVYQKALAISEAIVGVCDNLTPDGRRGLIDQITRASQSICLNLAEGCARTTPKDKANFFRIAKGSLFECVAVIDLLTRQKRLGISERVRFQSELAEIGRMLSGLIRYVEGLERKE